MPQLVIVMTYFNRQQQLNNTLKSFNQYNVNDFAVVIVDDCSPENIILPEVKYEINILKLTNKTWFNTASVHNWGFHRAFEYNPEIVIIQNAECQHSGNILEYSKKVTDETYISFGCYSLAQGETSENVIIKNKIAEYNGESSWYNHPVYRPYAFHFCCAITAKNLKKLNGFDERLCDGIAYEDNVFVHQVKNLGLKIEITEYPMVYHQYHYGTYLITQELIDHNKNIWLEIEKSNDYRAIHTLTPDL